MKKKRITNISGIEHNDLSFFPLGLPVAWHPDFKGISPAIVEFEVKGRMEFFTDKDEHGAPHNLVRIQHPYTIFAHSPADFLRALQVYQKLDCECTGSEYMRRFAQYVRQFEGYDVPAGRAGAPPFFLFFFFFCFFFFFTLSHLSHN